MRFESLTGSVTINIADWATLETEIADRLSRRAGFALATLNLDHLTKLRRDRDFAAAYAAQDLVTADGNPVVWLARLSGRPVNLVPGADCVVPLARIARDHGCRVALIGSSEQSLAGAGRALDKAVPGVHVALRIAPPMGFDPGSAAAGRLLARLQDDGIGLCFLALGAPKQELLAARGRAEAPSVGFASIGAGLDFLSGQQARAPRWLRRLSLEWLWRFARDPGRLGGRYLKSAAILPGLCREAVRQRRQP